MTQRLAALLAGLVVLLGTIGPASAGGPQELESTRLRSDADLEVFMFTDASDAQIEGVRSAIVSSPDVSRFAFVTKKKALTEFRRLFGKKTELGQSINARSLPVSFLLDIIEDESVPVVKERMAAMVGVESVAYAPEEPRRSLREICKDFEKSRPVPQAEVFMNIDATEEQIAQVRATIEKSTKVEEYTFLNKGDALEEFKRIFKDDPGLVASVTADELPTSFRVKLEHADQLLGFVFKFEELSGVDEVNYAEELSRGLKKACTEELG